MTRVRRRRDGSIAVRAPCAVALATLAVLALAPSALAATAAPHWSILSESEPTYFQAGAQADAYVLLVRNDGAAPAAIGEAMSISDTLPAGVIATKVLASGEAADARYELDCPSGTPLTGTVTCTYGEAGPHLPVLPGAVFAMTITVSIPEGIAALGANAATVSGGGAPSASVSEATTISPLVAPFGLSLAQLDTVEEDGEADTQAGSHPFELTSTLAFTVAGRETAASESPLASAAPKDLQVSLPAGVVGNPQAAPRCSQRQFLEGEQRVQCPLDTQVGTVRPFFYGTFHSAVFPLYDVEPPPGVPAELGFSVGFARVPLLLRLRSDGDYGLTAALSSIPEVGPLQGVILTLWGVPAASGHDLEREGALGEGGAGEWCSPEVTLEGGKEQRKGCPSGAPAKPFLTLPSRCESPGPGVGVEFDTWQSPGSPLEALAPPAPVTPSIAGCELLSFAPTVSLTPETTQAGVPSGYTLDVHVPQDEEPAALATPPLRSAVVSLPAGVTLSPSFANGLAACSASQFALHSTAPASCPPDSRLGTAKISTPLFARPVEGRLFMGVPQCEPCSEIDTREGRTLRLALEAQAPGATVKLEGSLSIDQASDQLAVSFPETPQLPFEDIELTLGGGASSPLENPAACGVPLAATAQLTPYSSEVPASPASAPFEVSGCAPQPFHPSFVAGTTNNRAGAPSPLVLTLSRADGEQQLRSLGVRLPPGLFGRLAQVPPCPVAAASALACAPQSEIGTATILAGPGPDPLTLEGRVYLTSAYEQAPYGLSIVVNAQAGPLDLGSLAIGARVAVDPRTAALSILTDRWPASIDGIPLQMKTIHLDLDRTGFVVNPTSCRAMAIEGTVTSAAGASVSASSRYQAADCAALAFKPRLSALAHARASKAGGVYLHVRLASASGQANVAALRVTLPRRLSVRQGALAHACPAGVFAANPAACPRGSVVGTASVLSPALSYPMIGPVYVISHAGAALPDLALVLQGDGVAIRLEGHTRVRDGVTSSTFDALPDVAISRLDLKLAYGPRSLLAATLPPRAHGSLCGQRLSMPATLTGQNGAVVKQALTIAVSGCGRAKTGRGGG